MLWLLIFVFFTGAFVGIAFISLLYSNHIDDMNNKDSKDSFLGGPVFKKAILSSTAHKDEECNECDYKKQVKELVKKEKKQRKEEGQ